MEPSGPRDSLRSHPQGPLEGTLDVSPTVYEGILSFRGLGKFGVYSQGMWAKSLKFGRLFKSFVVGHWEICKSRNIVHHELFTSSACMNDARFPPKCQFPGVSKVPTDYMCGGAAQKRTKLLKYHWHMSTCFTWCW